MISSELATRIATMKQDELWFLAGDRALTVEECEAVISRGDEAVLVSLAMNPDTPESILLDLSQMPDPVGAVAQGNSNAPVDAKDLLPIGTHSSSSIARYLEQRGASREQATFVASEYERSSHPGGRPLGNVWADAASR